MKNLWTTESCKTTIKQHLENTESVSHWFIIIIWLFIIIIIIIIVTQFMLHVFSLLFVGWSWKCDTFIVQSVKCELCVSFKISITPPDEYSLQPNTTTPLECLRTSEHQHVFSAFLSHVFWSLEVQICSDWKTDLNK